MNHPDIDILLDGEPEALRHARTCDDCREALRTLQRTRQVFWPTTPVADHLVAGAVQRIREQEALDRKRSAWGAAGTFLLTFLTVTPGALHGMGAWGVDAARLPWLLAVVLGLSALVTVLEPRFAKG